MITLLAVAFIQTAAASPTAPSNGLSPEAQAVGGSARVQCTITAEKTLTDCRVLSETPAGMGFGPAAVKMAERIKVDGKLGSGKPGETIRVPIRFAPKPVAAAAG